jgi:hypothetical protein
LREEGYPKLDEGMTKGNVGLFQPKKHTLLKQVYQKYETWRTNMEPPKANSLKM